MEIWNPEKEPGFGVQNLESNGWVFSLDEKKENSVTTEARC